MNPVELALEKQRLRLASARLRTKLAGHAAGVAPLFAAADRIRSGARWAGRHPAIIIVGLALAVAVRPGLRRFIWRWSLRSFAAWQLWRDRGAWLAK